MTKNVKIKSALASVKRAVEIRAEITELYKQYHCLSAAAMFSGGIAHWDFKRAVDAIHYFGGGWPSPGSKGRLEALLDNFVGVYRVLEFIGKAHMVETHLANLGVTIKLADAFKIDDAELEPNDIVYLTREYNLAAFGVENPKTLRELVTMLVDAADMIQTDICKKADMIKDGLRPSAKLELGIEDEEYDRLHDVVKFSMAGTDKAKAKAHDVRVTTAQSIHAFNEVMGSVAEAVGT
jgi:hypothetical protein